MSTQVSEKIRELRAYLGLSLSDLGRQLVTRGHIFFV